MATLTGAVRDRARARAAPGVMANNDGLAARACSPRPTGPASAMWRLPLHRRVPGGPQERRRRPQQHPGQRGGGAIMAGLFMREFAGGIAVGAPRHRGHRLHRARAAARPEGRHRRRGAHPARLHRGAGRPPVGARTRWRAASTSTPTPPASDGTLAPRELVAEAARRGVRVLAVTDHDSTDGLAGGDGEAAREHPPLEIVPGIEINCDVRGRRDPRPRLLHGLRRPRGSRTSAAPSGRSGAPAWCASPSGSPSSACRSTWSASSPWCRRARRAARTSPG